MKKKKRHVISHPNLKGNPSEAVKKKGFNLFCKYFAFFGPFAIYLYTLSPTLTLEDSGELITSAYTMGIAHPSGYPLYCFLGRLFTLLPIGDITWTAWKVNLMSAFFASCTCLVLYSLLLKLLSPPLIALSGALIFGFSKIFWSQAIIAEVYTLHSFLFIASIYTLLIWKESQKDKFLYLFSFIYGLSLTNHTAMILYAPFFLLFIFLYQNLLRKKTALPICGGLFLLGLSFYLYLPLRMGANNILNFGNIRTLKEIFFHIARLRYETLDFDSSVLLKEKFFYIFHFFKSLTKQYGPLLWVIGIIGSFVFLRKQKRLSFMLLGLFFMGSLGVIMIRHFHYIPENIFVSRVYFINSYLIFTVFIVLGFNFLVEKYPSKVLHLLFSVLFIVPLFFHFSHNNQRDNRFAYLHAKSLLNTLPSHSFLLHVNSDDFLFPLVYLQMVEKVRLDITIIDAYGAIFRKVSGKELCHSCPKDTAQAQIFKKYVEKILETKEAKSLIYFETPNLMKNQFFNFGVFYTKSPTSDPIAFFENLYAPILNHTFSENNFFEKRVLATYHLRYGETLYLNGKPQQALQQFDRATSINRDDHEIYYKVGQFLTSQGLFLEEASTYFSQAIKTNPYLAQAYNGLGAIAIKQKDYACAITHLQKALSLATYNKRDFHFNLGYAFLKSGNAHNGYSHLKLALSFNPKNYFAAYHLAQAANALGYNQEALSLYENLIKQFPQQSGHLQKLISEVKKN